MSLAGAIRSSTDLEELLDAEFEIRKRLKAMGVVVNNNNIGSNIAEACFSEAFGITRLGNSKDFDCRVGERTVQVKSAALTTGSTGTLYGYKKVKDEGEKEPFDDLALVIMTSNNRIDKGALVPFDFAADYTGKAPHTRTNGFSISLTGKFWKVMENSERVEMLTEKLRAAFESICRKIKSTGNIRS